MVEELPLYIVVEMIHNAKEKEAKDQIYLFWLNHRITSVINGTEIIPYEQMIKKEKTTIENSKSNEDILKEFEKIVEIDKKRGGN